VRAASARREQAGSGGPVLMPGSDPSEACLELTVCQQTLAECRRHCLLLAPGFDSQEFDFLTGLF